jgi:hypothetical protein
MARVDPRLTFQNWYQAWCTHADSIFTPPTRSFCAGGNIGEKAVAARRSTRYKSRLAWKLLHASEGRLMTAGTRNTSVVVTLITSMTLGAAALRGLELRLVPGKPSFKGSTLLMAERGMRVAEVEVHYAPSWDAVPGLGIDPEGSDSVCLIDTDGSTQWAQRGPHVQLVVIGTDGRTLGEPQKRGLLGALGTLNHASGRDLVPVRLAAGSDEQFTPGLPPQAKDLRALLERKGILP